MRAPAAATLLAVLVAMLPSAQALACDCSSLSAEQALSLAEVAFVGTVIATNGGQIGEPVPPVNPFVPSTAEVAVETVAKGIAGTRAVISSPAELGDCRARFAIGDRWRIYATLDDAGRLSTHACSGNELLAEGLPTPLAPGDEKGAPPTQLLLVVAVVALLAGVTAVAFLRKPAHETETR